MGGGKGKSQEELRLSFEKKHIFYISSTYTKSG